MMPDVKIIENGINKYLCFPKSKFSGEMSFNMLYMWPYEKNSIRKRVMMKAVLILFFRIFSKIKNPAMVPPEITSNGRSNSVGINTWMF